MQSVSINSEILGRGWKYPFGFDTSTGGVLESSDLERINDSLKQILGTWFNSRMFLRTFGSRLAALNFEPNDPSLSPLLEHYIRESLGTWEPRIQTLSVTTLSIDVRAGMIEIGVEYRVIQTNVIGNLVYPFYLTEYNKQTAAVTG